MLRHFVLDGKRGLKKICLRISLPRRKGIEIVRRFLLEMLRRLVYSFLALVRSGRFQIRFPLLLYSTQSNLNCSHVSI